MAVKRKTSMNDTCEITQKRIKNFLNTEVKEYAQYVLRTRTMPNIMDGLRTGARKIIYAAMTGDLSRRKFIKMPSLCGDAMKLMYAHGDASLVTTIVNLCTEHNNKYHPLEVIGQIPTLRVPNVEAAPRYLAVKKRDYLDWFKTDSELWTIQDEEGEKIEPKFFLPIIPLVLLNRVHLPGFGFSFGAMSYKLEDIVDNVLVSLTQGTCSNSNCSVQLTPEIVGIKQENIIYNSQKNQWFNVGEYELDFEKDTLIVKDLPYNVSFESYEDNLNKLKDKFLIAGWGNLSENDNIYYIIKFNTGRLRLIYNENKWKFFQTFRLYSSIRHDILNVIDEDQSSILYYETPYELIDAFVRKRLKYYDLRKKNTIAYLKDQIERYENKIKFITLVIDNELVIFKRQLKDIKEDLKKYNLPDYVLDMKFYNVTFEEITKLVNKCNNTKEQLKYIENTTIEEMYIYDIIEFREKYCGTHQLDKDGKPKVLAASKIKNVEELC